MSRESVHHFICDYYAAEGRTESRLGGARSGTSEFTTLHAELYKEREKRLFPFIHSAHRSKLISRSNGDRFRNLGALTFGKMRRTRTVFMGAIISIHSFFIDAVAVVASSSAVILFF